MPTNLSINMNQDVLYYVLFFKIDGTYGLYVVHTGIFKIHLFKCI